jgi:periplasmic divalent cation tolerance protein
LTNSIKPLIVLTTVGQEHDARGLARTLVERRLAACVNILGPVDSIYRWQGAVADDREQLLVIKTTDARLDELRGALLSGHPYEVPEFVVLEVDSIAEPYREWLISSCTPATPEEGPPGGAVNGE